MAGGPSITVRLDQPSSDDGVHVLHTVDDTFARQRSTQHRHARTAVNHAPQRTGPAAAWASRISAPTAAIVSSNGRRVPKGTCG
jgi:hypothetical protein